jgi:hypothetical protein
MKNMSHSALLCPGSGKRQRPSVPHTFHLPGIFFGYSTCPVTSILFAPLALVGTRSA